VLVRVSKSPTVKERIQPFFPQESFRLGLPTLLATRPNYPSPILLTSLSLTHTRPLSPLLFIDVDSSRFIQKDRIGFYRWNRAVRHGRKRIWKRRSFRVDWNGFRSSMGCLGRRDSKRKIWRVHFLSDGINFWFGWLSLFFLFAEKHILFLRDFVARIEQRREERRGEVKIGSRASSVRRNRFTLPAEVFLSRRRLARLASFDLASVLALCLRADNTEEPSTRNKRILFKAILLNHQTSQHLGPSTALSPSKRARR